MKARDRYSPGVIRFGVDLCFLRTSSFDLRATLITVRSSCLIHMANHAPWAGPPTSRPEDWFFWTGCQAAVSFLYLTQSRGRRHAPRVRPKRGKYHRCHRRTRTRMTRDGERGLEVDLRRLEAEGCGIWRGGTRGDQERPGGEVDKPGR